ncbi:glycerophosphoinositol permease [Saguinus oedipus]|uniref:Glycerophosphoinositol permease n=1 Tax=Saguinus oedipus TaxID=9490 RepID=A0ABQ9UCP7_SAGOE|nr:glycerophosphoinositol permease [Saguinus oedipus]
MGRWPLREAPVAAQLAGPPLQGTQECSGTAVTTMLAVPPSCRTTPALATLANPLPSYALAVQQCPFSECKKTLPRDPGLPTDVQLVTQQVIQCVCNIARAAKQLVTVTTKENNN